MSGTLRDLMTDPEPGAQRRFRGLYKARVVDPNDEDKRGRIKIVVPQVTGDEEHAAWAEPAALMLTPGKGYGSLWLPSKDDFVWVEFEDGDPLEPRWRAGWWGEDELPDVLKTNYPDVRGVVTKDGHQIIIDDHDHKLFVKHKDGHVVELSNDGAKLTTADKAVTIDAGQGQTTVKSASKVVIDAPDVRLASADASEPLALASKVQQAFKTLVTAMRSAKPVAQDGGAALQSAILTTLDGINFPPDVGSAKVKADR